MEGFRWQLYCTPLSGHKDDIYSLAFSPNGQILASGSKDTTVRLWQVSDGRLLRILKVQTCMHTF